MPRIQQFPHQMSNPGLLDCNQYDNGTQSATIHHFCRTCKNAEDGKFCNVFYVSQVWVNTKRHYYVFSYGGRWYGTVFIGFITTKVSPMAYLNLEQLSDIATVIYVGKLVLIVCSNYKHVRIIWEILCCERGNRSHGWYTVSTQNLFVARQKGI